MAASHSPGIKRFRFRITDGKLPPSTTRYLDPSSDAVIQSFNNSLEQMKTNMPHLFKQLQLHTKVIVPLKRSKYASGMSFYDCRGAAFITPDACCLDIIDHLIHENGHGRLDTIHDLEPLWLHEQDGLYESPWKAEPRPIEGILHGAYVFSLVAFSFSTALKNGHDVYSVLLPRIRQFHEQVGRALDTIDNSSALSDIGRDFVETIRLAQCLIIESIS